MSTDAERREARNRQTIRTWWVAQETIQRQRHEERQAHLARTYGDALAGLYARWEADAQLELSLLRTKLAILEGRYNDEGCIPVDLVEEAREASRYSGTGSEAVDE